MVQVQTVITMILLCIITIITQAKDGGDDHDHFDMDIGTTDSHDSDDDDHIVAEENVGRAIGITTFAGFASSSGVFIIFCVKKEYIAFMPASLAFSAGVTIHLTFMTLIPECVELFYHSIKDESATLAEVYAILCVICGILIMLCMETLFHKLGVDPHNHPSDPSNVTRTTTTNSESAREVVQVDSDNEEPNEEANEEEEAGQAYGAIAVESAQHVHDKRKESYSTYSRVSYSVAFAVILHHFPEAIATFVSLVHDFEFGIGVAFALSLHDIPSSVCISVPCYLATGSMVKPFILCGIAAITYPIGAFVGWIIIETTDEAFSDGFIAVLFGITGGIMLYISFVELLPTAIRSANKFSNENKSKRYSVNTITIILIFIGFLVMAISNILLKAVGGHSH